MLANPHILKSSNPKKTLSNEIRQNFFKVLMRNNINSRFTLYGICGHVFVFKKFHCPVSFEIFF